MTKRLVSVLLLSAALPLSAAAQTSPDTTTSDPAAGQTQPLTPEASGAQTGTDLGISGDQAAADVTAGSLFVTAPASGAWRVSDLEGMEVFSSDGESIGSIEDVLISQDDSVNAVIIDVGGFLGIGEKSVAVDIGALEMDPGVSAETTASTTTTPVPGETDTGAEQDSSAMASTPHDDLADAMAPDGTTGGTGLSPDGEEMAAGSPATTPVPGETDTGVEQDSSAMASTPQDDLADAMDPDGTTGGTGLPPDGEEMAAGSLATTGIGADDNLPGRIVLDVTRQQLEDAPEFEGMGGSAE